MLRGGRGERSQERRDTAPGRHRAAGGAGPKPAAADRRRDHRLRRLDGFVYVHAVGFAVWMLSIESNPWPKLTLIVSLEAIFLSTFVMIGQNR